MKAANNVTAKLAKRIERALTTLGKTLVELEGFGCGRIWATKVVATAENKPA